MSEMATRIDLATATARAGELSRLLTPYCRQILVVGSIRRQRSDVKDIELLVEPVLTAQIDLFGDVVGERAPIDGAVDLLLMDGTLAVRMDRNGRTAIGERYKRLLYQGVPFDLFVRRDPAQFGLLSVIRTGPAEFSQRLVTQRRFGGYLPDGWRVQDAGLYDDQGQPRETPDERDVFRLIGLDWIEPTARQ